ncbi:MAG: stage 0 sporulation family protein [Christensenellales bacterium]
MPRVGVKFVNGGKVFACDTDIELNSGDKVVVESIRGLELATISPLSKDENQEEVKSILRKATNEDLKKAEELKNGAPRIIKITNELIAKYKLEMKLVDVSFTIDGSKVIINYICEDRVDFRELVKDLASQLKLRIELRQIGIRDQAKIIGGIGFCGKECCCKKYLNDFDKVSIKMAKTQGLSLNPTKISGICGRLMCCLAYENDFYSEISSKMPKLNSKVRTKDGVGTVVYNNLLKQKVTVKIENENEIKVLEYDLGDLEVLPKVNPNQNMPNQSISKNKENLDKSPQKPKEESINNSNESNQANSNHEHKKNKKKFNKYKNKNKDNENKSQR